MSDEVIFEVSTTFAHTYGCMPAHSCNIIYQSPTWPEPKPTYTFKDTDCGLTCITISNWTWDSLVEIRKWLKERGWETGGGFAKGDQYMEYQLHIPKDLTLLFAVRFK